MQQEQNLPLLYFVCNLLVKWYFFSNTTRIKVSFIVEEILTFPHTYFHFGENIISSPLSVLGLEKKIHENWEGNKVSRSQSLVFEWEQTNFGCSFFKFLHQVAVKKLYFKWTWGYLVVFPPSVYIFCFKLGQDPNLIVSLKSFISLCNFDLKVGAACIHNITCIMAQSCR